MAPFLHGISGCFALTTLIASPSASRTATTTRTTAPRPTLLTDAGNSKKLLFEESWKSTLSPDAAREYLTTRSTWLRVTPDCEGGSIEDEESNTGEPGAWSMTSESGTRILCRNTIEDGDCDRDDGGCYLSYNVRVTSEDNLQFTFDIEYDLARDGTVRRTVYDIETIGLKSRLMKPLIRSPLIEMMQEENRKLEQFMN